MAYLNVEKVVIMFSRPYEMTNEDTGEIRRGITVEYYFFGDQGQFLQAEVGADPAAGQLGLKRSKCSLPYECASKLLYVPGVYDGQFSLNVDKDGKPSLRLEDVDFVGKCRIALEDTSKQDAATPAESKEKSDAAAPAENKKK